MYHRETIAVDHNIVALPSWLFRLEIFQRDSSRTLDPGCFIVAAACHEDVADNNISRLAANENVS